jgi:hypothetical protein
MAEGPYANTLGRDAPKPASLEDQLVHAISALAVQVDTLSGAAERIAGPFPPMPIEGSGAKGPSAPSFYSVVADSCERVRQLRNRIEAITNQLTYPFT